MLKTKINISLNFNVLNYISTKKNIILKLGFLCFFYIKICINNLLDDVIYRNKNKS